MVERGASFELGGRAIQPAQLTQSHDRGGYDDAADWVLMRMLLIFLLGMLVNLIELMEQDKAHLA